MRIQLQTLGCRLNEAELETWARQFRDRGYRIAGAGETADLVVVNTCAVTQDAVRKSRKLLRRSQRENPNARLVVSGCAASVDGPGALDETGIDLLVPNADKDRLVEIAARELALPLMPATAAEPDAVGPFPRRRQRAFIKVQDGCRYRCTFCIVTKARGEERSRPAGEVCGQINRLAAEGVREVVLTGVHLGGYGSDSGSSLHRLIERVLRDTDIPRIRLGSLEPWDIGEPLWQLFQDPRLMPHLHLPLQSGSDSVLRRMARRCKTDDFARLVERARRTIPDLNVTTDIIVGFPGETDAEWHETLEFADRIGFGHIHIFAYSPRAGTKAAGLPGQVPAELKKARGAALHQLARTMKRATFERFLGRTLPVLVEARCGDGPDSGCWTGYTPNYLPVRIVPAGIPAGETGAHRRSMPLAARSASIQPNEIRSVRLSSVWSNGEAVVASALDHTLAP